MVTKIDRLYRRRIGLEPNDNLDFSNLNVVLEKTALAIPFENLAILSGQTAPLSKAYLREKILTRGEGGLCYDLNPLLYYFLIENGFEARLVKGTVYNHQQQAYTNLTQSHVAILVRHQGENYLLDTGFGGNLPLVPVPLSGKIVESRNGQFRISETNNSYGDYSLEMKRKHKDTDWIIGYTFDSRIETSLAGCTEIQTMISEHPESSFNKNPLLTKHTVTGSITLTDTSFTQWIDGNMTKEKIDRDAYQKLLKEYFNVSTDR